eukprot:430324-Pelagomonas_calceolata.AAC.1
MWPATKTELQEALPHDSSTQTPNVPCCKPPTAANAHLKHCVGLDFSSCWLSWYPPDQLRRSSSNNGHWLHIARDNLHKAQSRAEINTFNGD